MGALMHGLGAYEPTCTPLATPLRAVLSGEHIHNTWSQPATLEILSGKTFFSHTLGILKISNICVASIIRIMHYFLVNIGTVKNAEHVYMYSS